MKVLVCREKHGMRLLAASTDEELHKSALKVVAKRLGEGYWYEGKDEQRAKAIVDTNDGAKAWWFLDGRSRHEYEGCEIMGVEQA